jgi:transcriptional regulator with GAF, ATPase, and Fis domain
MIHTPRLMSAIERSSPPDPETARLEERIAELQRERDQLVAVVDILQDISSSLHFVDILQAIARKLGETFGLDRCSIYLAGGNAEVRLVASYEDSSIRNLVVDLNRYPELKRAFESKETVFIPDAASDPMLKSIKSTLDLRNVRSIVVVPIQWQGAVIGAIFKIEDWTLSLAAGGDGSEGSPKTFPSAERTAQGPASYYVLQKVQARGKNTNLSKSK